MDISEERILNLRSKLSPTKQALLEKRLRGEIEPDSKSNSTIYRRSGTAHPPLSFAQQRLWFLQQLEPDNPFYNERGFLQLTGSLDIGALEQSVNQIVQRHEILRTTFKLLGGQPVQIIAPNLTLALPVVNLCELLKAEQENEVYRLATEQSQFSFDLVQGPLLRWTLLKLSEQKHVLLLTIHHIIYDSWSIGVIIHELSALYQAFSSGKSSPLPDLPIQYADFAVWQRQYLLGEKLESKLSYWKQQLENAPPLLQLPIDRPRPPVQTFRGAKHSFLLPKSLTQALRAIAQRAEATLFMTLLTAFKVLLYRYTRQADVIVGSPIANRNRAEIEGLIGFFVNTLVLRTNVSGNPTFEELLGRVQKVMMGAYANQELPFEKLVEGLQPERNLNYTPLFQVMFIFQNTPKVDFELSGLNLTPFDVEDSRALLDLRLDLMETDAGLKGCWEYNIDLFDADRIGRMSGHFQTLLEAISTNPQQRVDQLPLLTEPEKHQLLSEWNNTQADYPEDVCIHHLFEAQVEKTPDAVAVVFEEQQLTYQELNQQANQLAHYLNQLGVQPETLVGVCMERSLEMVVGLLGILKAGGAYVPIDIAYPSERLALLLSDSQISVLLTQRQLLERLPAHDARVLCLDTDWQDLDLENPPNNVTPENLAYLIYTSGSTGKPKGVQIPHRAVVNFLTSMAREPGLTSSDVLLAVTSISFDIAALELYLPLIIGARLELASREVATDPKQLAKRLNNSGATVMQATPATWRMLLSANWQGNPQLKMLCGGEALLRDLAEELLNKGAALWNLYGPTETTIWSTAYKVEAAHLSGAIAPIGSPIANSKIYLLDPCGQPVPVGVPGELHIGGAGLARGYLNRPELTAEKFITNAAGERLYRSGDLARYLPDGNIEYIERLDHQVKIRGFRIELGEIESVLSQHPDVVQAVVITRENEPGNKHLVAYVVARDESLTISQLREFLKQKLPEYMAPNAFAILDTIPLTPNGKLDRKALPATDEDFLLDNEFVAPSTPREEIIANIFASVLGRQHVGIHDNFFALGGHSLLATQLIARLRVVFDVEIPLRSVFESPTVAQLEPTLAQLRTSNSRASLPPIQPRISDECLPLSWAQERLWFLSQLEGANIAYNMPWAVNITGQLNTKALKQALSEIVRRHEILRTSFSTVNGAPYQVIHPDTAITVNEVDLQQYLKTEREAIIERRVYQEATTPFDLKKAPLIRFSLLQLDVTEYVLLGTMHHIVSDGWSVGVAIRELSSLYQSFCAGEPCPLAELPIQYADFAIWQRQWLSGEELETQLNYWRQQLLDVPELLQLPTDRPRPNVQSYQGKAFSFTLDNDLSQKLKAFSRESGTTLFITLYAAFATLLYRYSGQKDILIGSPIANRRSSEIEPLIGFFVNILVLRSHFENNLSFDRLLAQVKETIFDAYEHQDVPFEQIVETLQPQRALSHSPLFQVAFVLQNAPMNDLELPGVTWKRLDTKTTISRFDLTVAITETPQGLIGGWEYNTDLFDESTIERMAAHFQCLLRSIVENPQQTVDKLPLLSEVEQHQLLIEWNDIEADFPKGNCIHQLFETQVEKTPTAVAVVFENQQLTYQQLNQRANQLAHHLQSLGVKPENLVGICVERSLEMVVGLLGILKAGGAYVPLDPNYPNERLSHMLADSGVEVLLTQQPLLTSLPQSLAKIVCLDADWKVIEQYSQENLNFEISSDNLAYVIYTSGSTGQPKGVLVEHRNVARLLAATQPWYQFSANDVWTNFHSIAFDFSVWEIWGALSHGGRLVVVPYWMSRDPQSFYDLLCSENITVLNQTPSAFRQLINVEESDDRQAKFSLRLVIFGGEALEIQSLKLWFERHGDEKPQLVNMYGITETTVHVTYRPLTIKDLNSSGSVIGCPIPDLQMYILDDNLQPVPIGVKGQMYIGGAGLARGYLKRQQLTLERFIPNPFGHQPEDRLYKTGDLARYSPNSDIEYLGRIDNQVKIRGFRIELGEIEAALVKSPVVREVTVLAREDNPGVKRLVAYVVPNVDAPNTQNQTGSAESQAEQISQWRQVFNETYSQPASEQDLTFNIIGWNDSYTGQPIPPEQMAQWVDSTVEQILSRHPQRILEIGCGTGLLLLRIAPHCSHYLGTDISQQALDYIEQQRQNLRGNWSNVRLCQKTADDFEGIESEAFDAVILNSVVQYFPSIDYLATVLEGAVKVVKPGGFIYVGDVRSLPLLKAFHADIELHKAANSLPCKELQRRVQKSLSEEQELVIDPAFFRALKQHIPQISHVQIDLKRGRYHNELTRFRYEVVIQVGDEISPIVEPQILDWCQAQLTLPAIRQSLVEAQPECLVIQRIPNARVQTQLRLTELLTSEADIATVGDLREALAASPPMAMIEPEDFWELSDEFAYEVYIDWSDAEASGCYDVVLQQASSISKSQKQLPIVGEPSPVRPWRTYGNSPLQGKLMRQLVPQLRSCVKESLPDYMMPSAFVTLEALPLTPNGKIDRQALPAPDTTRSEEIGTFVAPSTDAEKALADIWAQILRLEKVGIHDNFFELGGDSILSIQIVARANQAGLKLTPKQVFEHQTIAELATVAATGQVIQAQQGLVTGQVALTPIQHWFFEQNLPEAHHWNQSILLEVRQALDPQLLQQTMQSLLEHHDALRLRFAPQEASWQQWESHADEPTPFTLLDLSTVSEAEQSLVISTAATDLQASLNLSAGPLMRVVYFDFGTTRPARLLWVIHHLAVDGVSWRILLEDFQRVYEQLTQGQEIQLPPKTTSFQRWAERLQEYGRSEVAQQELDYWLSQSRQPVNPIPVDFPGGENTVASASVVSTALSQADTQALLQEVPKAYQTRINDVLLTALAQALAEWTGNRSLLVDLEGHGREDLFEDVDLSRTVGWFTTLFPVVLNIEASTSPNDALKTIKEQIRSIPKRGIGYGVLRYLLSEEASSWHHRPQAEIMFNYLGQTDQVVQESYLLAPAQGTNGSERSLQASRSHLLDINGIVAGGRLRLNWTYSKALYQRDTIETLAQSFIAQLRSLIHHCQSPDVGGYTPSDFQKANVTQVDLDELMAQINQGD